MSKIYDDWDRLVDATLKREQFRFLALAESRNTSFTSTTSNLELDYLQIDDDEASSSNTMDSDPYHHDYSETSFDFSDETEASISTCPVVQPIAFKELKEATKNLGSHLLLGRGRSGDVYKGWLHEHTLTATKPGKGVAVAIKKWTPFNPHGHWKWLNEINLLRQLHHPNLVKLIGYSFEDANLLLVYEFMPKGSLDSRLFKGKHRTLSWTSRINIADGAARGLSFLHDKEINVIHRNFTPAAILLDEEFNVKLSGFGMTRKGPIADDTHVTTRVMGTCGYVAPEYVSTGHLTPKCDVFGFGVVLLELLSGRRAVDKTKVLKEQNLVELAKYLHDKNTWLKIVDKKLKGQCTKTEALALFTLALSCLSLKPETRPPMNEVLAALKSLKSPRK